ncbi:MAG: cytochrome c oxidase subunit II [Bacillota bacterium]|nr:cytochrome c oxidase subunit II [Bacillota bacterium]
MRRFVFLAGALFFLTGCRVDYPASVLDPAGPVAQAQLKLLALSFLIMAGIATVVLGLLLYAALRFRQKPGDEEDPPASPGVTWVEVLWTAIPLALLLIMAIPTYRTTFYLAKPPTGNPLPVEVVAHQFWWEFRYPDQGIITANELHIPVGRPVEMKVRSADVVHSFWIPRLGGKLDAAPGRTNRFWLQADEPGAYPGVCAQLCGAGHAQMHLVVQAQTEADFYQWVQAMKAPYRSPTDTLALAGEAVFAKSCQGCHAIGGSPYKGRVGPDLTAFHLRTTLGAGLVKNTPENLIRWIEDPLAMKYGVLMPSGKRDLNLSDAEIQALVAFLEGKP